MYQTSILVLVEQVPYSSNHHHIPPTYQSSLVYKKLCLYQLDQNREGHHHNFHQENQGRIEMNTRFAFDQLLQYVQVQSHQT
jgi:hypothetical protein